MSKTLFFTPYLLLIGSLFTIVNDEKIPNIIYLVYNSISCMSMVILGICIFLKPEWQINIFEYDDTFPLKRLNVRGNGVLCVVVGIFSAYILLFDI